MRPSRGREDRGGDSSGRRLELIRERCLATGLRLTEQRREVVDALLDLPDHPKADSIQALVASRAPGISRTTTYRTLERLVRAGVIDKASHPGNVVRYDGRIEPHHHLLCTKCEVMIDIASPPLDRIPIPDASAVGFEVRDFRVQFRGLCRRCSRHSEKEGQE